MEGTYKIGDCVIRIVSQFERIHLYCGDYRWEGNPDLTVAITQEDLKFEREKSRQTDLANGQKVIDWSDGYLETLAVYRKIAEKMPFRDTFLFHGSAIATDGKAYLFTAKSGTGKSTHTRLWRQALGDQAVMVNDDKPLIRIVGDGAVVYGTPWNGKHRLGSNISVPLEAVCILERSKENHINEITKAEAYPMLLQQSYRPADKTALIAELSLIEKLNVRFYRLGCNMNPEAADVAMRGMGVRISDAPATLRPDERKAPDKRQKTEVPNE